MLFSSAVSPSPVDFSGFVKEALSASDFEKMRALFAAGHSVEKICRAAKEALSKSDRVERGRKLQEIKVWHREQGGQLSSEAFASSLLSSGEQERVEELLRFYAAAGGNFSGVAAAIEKRGMPLWKLQERVRYLDLICRIAKIEVEVANRPKGKRSRERKGVGRFFSNKRVIPSEMGGEKKVSELLNGWLRKESSPFSLLLSASAHGYSELAREIARLEVDINRCDSSGFTALHYAASNNHLELVKWLIDSGASLEARNVTKESSQGGRLMYGETALHLACRDSRCYLVVEELIRRGASIEALSGAKQTPLHYASFGTGGEGSDQIARLLLEKGADLEARNDLGETPLHLACSQGNHRLVSLFIDRGASLLTRDRSGRTPLQHAAELGLKSVERKELIDYFRKHPHKLLKRDGNGRENNPLEFPLLFADKEIAEKMRAGMSRVEYERALYRLQESYPSHSFDLLIDCGYPFDAALLYRASERERELPPPPIELSRLERTFGSLELFFSEKLEKFERGDLLFDEAGSAWRISELKAPEGSTPLPAIAREELIQVDAEVIPLQALKGLNSPSEEALFQNYILKVGGQWMVVNLKGEGSTLYVEPTLELFKALFKKINFTSKERPGYRSPEGIGAEAGGEGEPVEKLRKSIDWLIHAVNRRIPFVGTPKESEPEKLQKWYGELEFCLKKILIHCLTSGSDSAIEGERGGEGGDPTPWAPLIIELAISANYCGSRVLSDAEALARELSDEFATVEEIMIRSIQRMKEQLANAFLDREDEENAHAINGILQIIDEWAGISEEEKLSRYYFWDPLAKREVDKSSIEKALEESFTPSALIDAFDDLINREHLINLDLKIAWFNDHVPSEWRESYWKIQAEWEKCSTKEEKSALLDKLKLLPLLPRNAPLESFEWYGSEEFDMKYHYILKCVQNQKSGNVERGAIIHLLREVGILRKCSVASTYARRGRRLSHPAFPAARQPRYSLENLEAPFRSMASSLLQPRSL